jgi:tetratricopeptide (TPR) repeat protein
MLRRYLASAAVVLAFASIPLTFAAELSLSEAFTLVDRDFWSKEPPPTPEQLTAARNLLDAQAAKEPKDAKWVYGLGRISDRESERLTGDARGAKHKDALERMRRAVELDPRSAKYQFWLGSTAFDRIDDVNMLSQVSLASEGRKAFETAVELDPSYLPARIGLAQYYLQAPSIAGGSVDKAKAQAEAMLRVPDHVGDYQGQMTYAGIAAHEKNWAEMSRRYTLAESAKGVGNDPLATLRTNAVMLLTRAHDPKAAGPVVERYLKLAPADDVSGWFLDGEVKRQLGHCAEALPLYDKVLAKVPEARGSRLGAAVCHEQLGQKDAAKRDYEEFLKRYPKDERAVEAKAALKRLG